MKVLLIEKIGGVGVMEFEVVMSGSDEDREKIEQAIKDKIERLQ